MMLDPRADRNTTPRRDMTAELLALAMRSHEDRIDQGRRLAADLVNEADMTEGGDDFNDGRASGLRDAARAIRHLLGLPEGGDS